MPRHIRSNGFLVVVTLLAVFLLSAAMTPAKEPTVASSIQSVSLFKNGLGFFIRNYTLPEEPGVFMMGPFPAASHGTFWITYPYGAQLKNIVSKEKAYAEPLEAINLTELVKANVGNKARLTLTDGTYVTGTIVFFPDDRTTEAPSPYASGRSEVSRYSYVPPSEQARLVLVQTEEGLMAFDPATIKAIQFTEAEVKRTIDKKRKSVFLQAELVKTAADSAEATGTISYLAKGITWAPSYMIDISKPDTAILAAKAVIINEVEDLAGAEVQLITGYPNLQFSDVPSPVALKLDLAQFLQALASPRTLVQPGAMANVMVQSARYAYETMPGAVMPEYGTATSGEAAEDLFLYPLENVTLAKGETGYYPLFSQDVPYEHIYEWEIPDYVNEEDRYGGRSREERTTLETVWHSVQLKNETGLPLTTAPAEIVSGNAILGQDTLNYTPKNAEATVKITQAVGVKAEQNEYETDRQREAERYYGYSFDRVTITGELSVRNFKDEKIHLEITKTLSGEMKEVSLEAHVTKIARGLKRMNPTNILLWDIELDNGETVSITYTYDVLVRR